MTTLTPTPHPKLLLNAQYLPSSVDWRSADEHTSPFSIHTFIEEAQRAEAAGFDALFQADFSGVNRAALRSGPPLTVFEPFQAAAIIATSTTSLAVMPTVSTLHTHPFSFARSLSSLDRISNGRAWINVVSSFRPGTGIGSQRIISRAQRHEQTTEFLDVARRLWHSWPPAANSPDTATDRYIRDDLVIDIDHHGEFYDQPGPIDMPPLSAHFPFTLQPTSSLEGLQLAARTADGVFAGTPTLGAAKALRRILQDQASQAGRAADAVALLPGCYLQVVDSETETRLKSAAQHRLKTGSASAATWQLKQRFPLLQIEELTATDPLPADVLPEDPLDVLAQFSTHYLPIWDILQNTRPTVGELAAGVLDLAEHAKFIGTPERIADDLVQWIETGAVDGFQIILGTGFDSVVNQIVPAVVSATHRSLSAHTPTREIDHSFHPQ